MKVKKISYQDITQKALGKTMKRALEGCLALLHFIFTINQLAFII